VIYRESAHCAALVLDTDESTLIDTGLIRSGEQLCTLRLLGTSFEGQITTGVNLLTGSLTQDKLFERAIGRWCWSTPAAGRFALSA
jgi:hypothetical protein